MKIGIVILIFLSPLIVIGQSLEKRKIITDSVVQSISGNKDLNSMSFKILALKKVRHYITYQYQTKSGNIVCIERQFSNKNDSIRQSFFLKDGQLIYANETIVTHYGSDSIAWSGSFYFSKGKLIDYITLGHGKSEMESWNPQADVKNSFYEAKRDILRHRKLKNGG